MPIIDLTYLCVHYLNILIIISNTEMSQLSLLTDDCARLFQSFSQLKLDCKLGLKSVSKHCTTDVFSPGYIMIEKKRQIYLYFCYTVNC